MSCNTMQRTCAHSRSSGGDRCMGRPTGAYVCVWEDPQALVSVHGGTHRRLCVGVWEDPQALLSVYERTHRRLCRCMGGPTCRRLCRCMRGPTARRLCRCVGEPNSWNVECSRIKRIYYQSDEDKLIIICYHFTCYLMFVASLHLINYYSNQLLLSYRKNGYRVDFLNFHSSILQHRCI